VGLVLCGRVAVLSPADAGGFIKQAKPFVLCQFIRVHHVLAAQQPQQDATIAIVGSRAQQLDKLGRGGVVVDVQGVSPGATAGAVRFGASIAECRANTVSPPTYTVSEPREQKVSEVPREEGGAAGKLSS
jgi:hypothetical protein